MIVCDFTITCDGKDCTATFSDGLNRDLQDMHDAWVAARNEGWRAYGIGITRRHLCPKCATEFFKKENGKP
jgi:hypothetical protein